MARITESVPTPIASEIQQTIFQIHKAQADIDPITNKEFQWSALKGKVVGTFYDKAQAGAANQSTIGFGLDVDTFFAPHCYEVYAPRSDHLSELINAFGEDPNPLEIGYLRYTETPSTVTSDVVQILVDPKDFIGRAYGHRTALFGKTRFGKSNTMKVIADTVLQRQGAGQIIFDPSGEYTYWNEQDNGCLAARYAAQCDRFSLRPRTLPIEQQNGLTAPRSLLVNFFAQPDVGHSLIFSLWEPELGHVPDYIVPAQNWEPQPTSQCPTPQTDPSGHNHYWRTMGIWYAILQEAGFQSNPAQLVPIDFPAAVKTEIINDATTGPLVRQTNGTFANRQPLGALPAIWKKVDDLLTARANMFPASRNTGEPYFNAIEKGLLRILNGNVGSGARKFSRFTRYHSLQGSNVFEEITRLAQTGRTVFVDLSMGDEKVRKSLAERISQTLLVPPHSGFDRLHRGSK